MPIPVTIKYSKANIDKKVMASRSLQKKGLERAQVKLDRLVRLHKTQLLREFGEHSVTREIEEGPFAPNRSGTLGGYGNLYSFIGFHYGTEPTEEIKELLRESIFLNRGRVITRGWSFRVSLPTKAAIRTASPVPWEAGNSWVYGVEDASISGLKYYVAQKGKGYSRGGFQEDEIVNNLVMSRTSYLSDMLEKFQDNLRSLNR